MGGGGNDTTAAIFVRPPYRTVISHAWIQSTVSNVSLYGDTKEVIVELDLRTYQW